MADLTLKQRFGSNVTFEDLDGDKFLTINLNDLEDQANGGDFTNGLGLDMSEMFLKNQDEYASKILWALVQLSKQNQSDNNTDETIGIYITNQGKRNVIRNGQAQLGFQELLTGYTVDPTGLTLDPDLVGNQANRNQT